jgi:hypothetical protein
MAGIGMNAAAQIIAAVRKGKNNLYRIVASFRRGKTGDRSAVEG